MNNGQLQRAPEKDLDSILRRASKEQLVDLVKIALTRIASIEQRLCTPLYIDEKATSMVRVLEVSGALIKATVTCQSGPIIYDHSQNELIYNPPAVTFDVVACREGDLIDAQKVAKTGQDQVQIRKWIGKLRQADEAPKPIQIKIVNANELAPAGKVMTVKRDSSGKLSGAVVESVPDPS
jgi:hypothetical protein